MKRQVGEQEIILGDCHDILKSFQSESVDAVVSDPPFGLGKNYNGKKEQHSNPEEYWKWLKPIYDECLRILRPGGFCALYQTTLYLRHLWSWYGDDIRVWIGAKNFVQLRKTPINYGYDPVIMRYKEGTPLRPAKPRRNLDFFVANTAAMVSDTTRIERRFPYPRPLDAVTEIVDNFVLPGGTVLDPFAGSGTIAVACQNTGRKSISIELEQEYFDLIVERLEKGKQEIEQQSIVNNVND